MRVVVAHVSNPYIGTAWTTATYVLPGVWASAPSLHNTLDSHDHFRRSLSRFHTTPGQSFSDADRSLLRYLKEVTGARDIP